jgi:hypothetical protein
MGRVWCCTSSNDEEDCRRGGNHYNLFKSVNIHTTTMLSLYSTKNVKHVGNCRSSCIKTMNGGVLGRTSLSQCSLGNL